MKNRNKVYDSLILIMQFGINMIVPIFMCWTRGFYLPKIRASVAGDSAVFLGAAAGFQNCYRMAQRLWQKKDTGKVKSDVKKDK